MYLKCKECLSFDDCKVKNREHPDCTRCKNVIGCPNRADNMCYCWKYDREYTEEEIKGYLGYNEYPYGF